MARIANCSNKQELLLDLEERAYAVHLRPTA